MQIKKILLLSLIIPCLTYAQYDNWLSWTNWLTKEKETAPEPIAVWRADYGITTVDTGGTYPTVSSWLSTNGEYNVVQTTATRRPLYNTDSVALKFDGVDDYLFYNASNPNIFDPRTGDYSITAWIYIPFEPELYKQYGYMLSKGFGVNTSNTGFTCLINTDIINNAFLIQHIVSSSTNVIANFTKGINNAESAWYHIVISADRNGELIIYINGVNKGYIDISTYNNDDVWSPYPFKIGTSHSNVNCFHSYIAEVRYYKVALTQSEVQALYNAGRPQ